MHLYLIYNNAKRTVMKLLWQECSPACSVLIVGSEGVVQGLLVVEMEHVAVFLSLWSLSQFDSESLQR